MTWVWVLASLWLVVSCIAALVIGHGLRVAEQAKGLRRAARFAPSYDAEVVRSRRLAG